MKSVCEKCMRKTNYRIPACVQYYDLLDKNHSTTEAVLALMFGCEYAQKAMIFVTQMADEMRPLLKRGK